VASGRYKKTEKRATKRSGVRKDERELRDGEVRRGPGGKLNVYDEETGRWYRAKKRDTAKKSDRKTTSGTVTSGKRATSRETSPTKKGSYQSGTGGGKRYKAAAKKARKEKASRSAPLPGEFNRPGTAQEKLTKDLIKAARKKKGYTSSPRKGARITLGKDTYRWNGSDWQKAN